jgi:hypothetical protein
MKDSQYTYLLELAIMKEHNRTQGHEFIISSDDMNRMIKERMINGVNQTLISNPGIRVTVDNNLPDGKLRISRPIKELIK